MFDMMNDVFQEKYLLRKKLILSNHTIFKESNDPTTDFNCNFFLKKKISANTYLTSCD